MTTQQTRNYAGLAIAIIVAALIVGSITYITISPTGKTVTLTTTVITAVTTTVPTTLTKTLSTTIPSTLTASCDSSSTLHCVVFQQLGACSPDEFWGIPWSVTIGNSTEVQPPGTTLPLDNYGLGGTLNENFTVIVFSLPSGLYNFSVSPSAGFFTPTTGSVRVNGTDVLVEIAYTGTSCVTTTHTSTASMTTVNGSSFSADNVTGDITVGNPGYSYFLNGSVTFMGVTFATICLPVYAGCPIPPGTSATSQETVGAGAISLNVRFPDGTNETIGDVIGPTIHFFVLSHHANPQAGILIVDTTSGYKSYLLVSYQG